MAERDWDLGGFPMTYDPVDAGNWRERITEPGFLGGIQKAPKDRVFVVDRDLRVLYANPALQEQHKIARPLEGKRCHELIYQRKESCVVCPALKCIKSGKPEKRTLIESGAISSNPMEILCFPVFLPDHPKVIEVIGVVRELPDIVEIERQFQESQHRWQYALESSDQLLWDWDVKSGKVHVSEQWNEMMGFPQDRRSDAFDEWSSLVHPDDYALFRKAFDQHFYGETPAFHCEIRVRNKDGSYRWVQDRGKTLARDESGHPLRVIGTRTDITIQKNGELALRAVAECATLLNDDNLSLDRRMAQMVRTIQTTLDISRVYVYENFYDPIRGWCRTQIHECCAEGIEPQISNPKLIKRPYSETVHTLLRQLLQKKAFKATISELEGDGTDLLESQGIRSLLVLPIYCGEQFWGFLGFDDCLYERIWHENEIHLLEAIAICIGSAIQRVQSQEKIREAKEEAEKATQDKSTFLSSMSHEIRLPLNGIMGFLELLEQSSLSQIQREYIEYIRLSSGLLNHIVENIMNYEQISVGKMKLHEEPADLKFLCHSVMQLVEIHAKKKNIDLQMDYDDTIPRLLLIDELRVQQVLLNLLGNGVKFTQAGHVRLTVSLRTHDPQKMTTLIRFEVEDTGIGIPEEAIHRIQEPFEQAGPTAFRKYGGVGLGLFIIKGILQIMRSSLHVQSQFGHGSRFYFDLEAPYRSSNPIKQE